MTITKSDTQPDTDVISVLIADDCPVVREGLSTIFKRQKDIKVVAQATNGQEALELCDQHSPDVLLLDQRMPKMDGLQVINELAARRLSKPRVIVMTTHESEEDIRRALKAGAKGYLVKGAVAQQILESVRRVAAGESLIPATVASKLAESMARPELSKRERQVLEHIANGRSNKEIGQILHISEHTIKTHVEAILTKLEAIDRTEAIAVGIKRGLIKPAD